MINVVHFSITPLAGAPIRLVQALNRLTDIKARLVDLKRYDLYDHDLIFSESPREVIQVCNHADIIHLHNYLDLNSSHFLPISFKDYFKAGKIILRHFHSTSDWIAEQMDISEDQLASCPLPSLVIAQYPERFFPKARIVPNIIPHSLLSYKPPNQDELSTGADIFFSPTKSVGAFERRWDTKGAPETSAMLKRVAKRTGCSIQIMTGKPLAEVLKEKRKARIVVDDLVTGSYHLTGLEGLAQGKPVLSFLDSRCLYLLQQISESPYCPFINVRLEDAERVLTWLVEHPETCADIGEQGRKWIENNWNENKLINIFTNIYKETISVTEIRECDTNYNAKTKHEEFFNKILPDLVFESRKKNYDKSGVAPNWTGHPANLKR